MAARLLKFPRMPQPSGDHAVDEPPGLSAAEREFLPECLEILETPPSPYQRAVVWTLATVIVSALLWSAIGTLEVVSSAPGRFIPDGRIKVMQVTETAIVKALHVREGQQVKAGDLMMELDPTLSGADLAGSAGSLTHNELNAERLSAELSGRQARYGDASHAAVALQETLRQADEAAYTGKLDSAQAELAGKRAALGAAEATLNKQAALLAIAQEQEKQNAGLLADTFISRAEYLDKHQSLVSTENDHAAQLRTVEQARQDVRQAEQALALVSRDHRASLLKELNDNVSGHADLQAKFDRAREMHALKWLRAPASGYVQSVAVTTTGGVVTPAQSLVTIVPDGTPLIVEATLSNEDIGYVKVGQPVNIKVDTYPFQRYGTLSGTLSWVSPDAETREAAASNDPGKTAADDKSESGAGKPVSSPPVYRVHIRLDPGSRLMVDHHPALLRPGMSVQADITTDHRRIYEFFLAPIVKYINEGVTVR
ncbi:MAG TPA: HlyD family type I secretion periplasmic adaptor subunit [Candidatus Aquabacterium excrementipullorum]|nr:HlyD family type I secretion periplasmic adaptor subunit [Candidatus Aquabacterium excrementipullorum]